MRSNEEIYLKPGHSAGILAKEAVFRSKAQQRFMFVQHPRIARRWADKQKKSKGRRSFKTMSEKLHPEKRVPRSKFKKQAAAFADEFIKTSGPVVSAPALKSIGQKVTKIVSNVKPLKMNVKPRMQPNINKVMQTSAPKLPKVRSTAGSIQ